MEFEETGMKQNVTNAHGRDVPYTPGAHLWVAAGVWMVNPGGEEVHLDAENLLTIKGPFCWWCENEFSDFVNGFPCVRARDDD